MKHKVQGDAKRPRVAVYRSNQHIYAQAVNDADGSVVASANDINTKSTKEKMTKTQVAEAVGAALAKKKKKKKIDTVVFDRSGYKYHGRVKAVAEALRKEGLKV